MTSSPSPFQPGGEFRRPLGFSTGPRVTGIDPPSSRITGGGSVTITGFNFGGTPTVLFGVLVGTSVVVVNANTITCVVPVATVAEIVDITVTQGSQSGVGIGIFTYFDAHIIKIVPYFGPVAGGTTVILEGSDFPASVTTLTFNGIAATSVVRIDSGRISCVTPAKIDGEAGFVDVVLT